MPLLFFLLLFFLVTYGIPAQPDKEWRTLFSLLPPPYIKEQFITRSLALSDGSSIHALVMEYTSLGCDYRHYGVARLSPQGELRWIKPHCSTEPLEPYEVFMFEDYLGRYIVGTYHICLPGNSGISFYCLDSTGTIQYCRVLGGTLQPWSISYMGGCPTLDGGFVITGYENPGSPAGSYIYKVNSLGQTQWIKQSPVPVAAIAGFDTTYHVVKIYANDIIQNMDSTYSMLAIVYNYTQPNTIPKITEFRFSSQGDYLSHAYLDIPFQYYAFSTSSLVNSRDFVRYFMKKKYSDKKIILMHAVSDKPGYDKQILLEYDTSGQVLWMLNLYKPANWYVARYFLPDSTLLTITPYGRDYVVGRRNIDYNYVRMNLAGQELGNAWESTDWKVGELWYSTIYPFNQSLNAGSITLDSCLIFSGTGRENALLTLYERGIYYVEKRCGNVFLNNHDQAESPDGEDMTPLLGYDAVTGAPVPVVYPNPGSGQYHLGYTEPLQRLRVWDGRGALILDGRPEGNRFSLQGLPAGLYLWEATDTRGRTHRGKLMQRTE